MYSKKRQTKNVTPLSALLPKLSAQLGMDRKVQELAVTALWPQVLEKTNFTAQGKGSHALRVETNPQRQATLVIGAVDGAQASNLSLNQNALLKAVNSFSPQTGLTIDTLRFTVR